ncbi:uncharacterized protein LOC125688999 [Lagopus muta]|uniref:uncharacterized protein LOC125688999 n=1 Tax=Lagopus muta TaxID=64668 RepID=UPI0020A05BBA|nr:uncharacterized protein LOC125688999 [Lagopus muta]
MNNICQQLQGTTSSKMEAATALPAYGALRLRAQTDAHGGRLTGRRGSRERQRSRVSRSKERGEREHRGRTPWGSSDPSSGCPLGRTAQRGAVRTRVSLFGGQMTGAATPAPPCSAPEEWSERSHRARRRPDPVPRSRRQKRTLPALSPRRRERLEIRAAPNPTTSNEKRTGWENFAKERSAPEPRWKWLQQHTCNSRSCVREPGLNTAPAQLIPLRRKEFWQEVLSRDLKTYMKSSLLMEGRRGMLQNYWRTALSFCAHTQKKVVPDHLLLPGRGFSPLSACNWTLTLTVCSTPQQRA